MKSHTDEDGNMHMGMDENGKQGVDKEEIMKM